MYSCFPFKASRQPSPEAVVNLITQAAAEAFKRREVSSDTWFDSECKTLRGQAMSVGAEERHAAFRTYKNHIKSKKRRFLKERQQSLIRELAGKPWLFWRRLRAKRLSSDLCEEELRKYVAELYYFPEAQAIHQDEGEPCVFTMEEVEQAITHLGTGKAADLLGLSAELLQWGVEVFRS
ncbi:hypothetical protein R1sor_023763 [Riccia sorocarpa]|uniref:Uncharacterized protein n=1 Tax=Riccia sorocarpa TaxID=122646 RepID=A0ABD3GNL4_9MARC